ncbi:MAG TPA: cytochrome c oxidase assembly protein [Microbacteriaceae bacterium]|nr:cytochrome c oxidase assembly protein [Microbacteriaceae bacterium]
MRPLRVFGLVTLLGFATIGVFIGLAIGGGAAPLRLEDPGPFVRYAMPIVSVLTNLGFAGFFGALILALWAIAPARAGYGRTVDVAAAGAALVTLGAGGTAILTFVSVSGKAFSPDATFGAQLWQFLTDIELGRAWLIVTLVFSAVTALTLALRKQLALLGVGLLALVAVYQIAQQGHAAGSAGHFDAVSAYGFHLVFAAVWLGGLVTLVIVRPSLDASERVRVLTRYSTVALVCFIVVAVSGYVSAALRLGNWGALDTPYGVLVLGKVSALVLLGLLGFVQRTRLISRMSSGRTGRTFALIVVLELAFMGLASGLAAALARTQTPVSQSRDLSQLTPAERLTGSPLPPPPDVSRYLSQWHLDIIWVLVVGFGTFFYLAAVWRLNRRGDRWPIYRTVLWVLGMAVLFFFTNGGIAVYEQYLFSAHMLGHMGLTMAVPILLVPGAPVTLALRAIAARTDGSRGTREWILIAVHSWYGRLISNPVVAALLFAGSLWLFYYTPMLRWAMVDHLGHEFMTVHFLITGYLFVQSLIGSDPVPFRFPYPVRIVVLLATMTVHAFFGVSLMSGTGLLAADWFGAMGWGTDALLDQQTGGGIAWSIGELPILALALTIVIQWSRSEERETKRLDRNADRTGDADLKAYNSRLADLAARDTAGR